MGYSHPIAPIVRGSPLPAGAGVRSPQSQPKTAHRLTVCGTVKIIACIEDPPVIERILNHLATKGLPGLWGDSRAPPAERGRLLN
jgi:hypothetical protein